MQRMDPDKHKRRVRNAVQLKRTEMTKMDRHTPICFWPNLTHLKVKATQAFYRNVNVISFF